MDETEPQGDAWNDLIKALTLLREHPASNISPLHCAHDTLWAMADAELFTEQEIAQLDTWGFFVADEGGFKSFRFGSA